MQRSTVGLHQIVHANPLRIPERHNDRLAPIQPHDLSEQSCRLPMNRHGVAHPGTGKGYANGQAHDGLNAALG